MFVIGDRVIQIPIEWPSRKGTVASCDADHERVLIAWDDGRSDWIAEADYRVENLWLISPTEQANA